jgi:transcription termination factor Rho
LKVKLLTNTTWEQKFRPVGSELEVPDKVGLRWVRHKIAASLEPEKLAVLKEPTAAELKKIAKKFGIEGYAKMNKAELVTAIEAKQAEIKKSEEEKAELEGLRERARTFGVTSVETMTEDELREAIYLGSKIAELKIEGAESMTKDEVLAVIAEAKAKE